MTRIRCITEMGMGVDVHGRDATKAARRAVSDAIRHSSLGFFRMLGKTAQDMYVDVTIGVPDPAAVDVDAVATELPYGTVTVTAVAGGLEVEPVLGSTSTDLRGGFGGLDGRALQAGDRLAVGERAASPARGLQVAPWWIDANPLPYAHPPAEPCTIRLLPGTDVADGVSGPTWRADARSNRQGLRLQGPALQVADRGERISEPVAPGTVQLPPDGQPIVLLADAQTHGGYPRIGHVIRADIPLLAQMRPGARLRFLPCTPVQACAANAEQRQRLHRIALAIDARTRAR